MFQLDPHSLTDARVQLHWVAQLLAAAADAKLAKLPDDSQSNLAWDETNRAIVARTDIRLEIPEMTIRSSTGEPFPLIGKTLSAGRDWLSEQVGAELVMRQYEMPNHAVAEDVPFNAPRESLTEIASWFSFASQAMEKIGNNRVWPHHFDLGWLIEINGPETSIGGGMSPGDAHFDQPYFYVNAYGMDKPDEFPTLDKGGHWAKDRFGAVMTADQVVASDEADSLVRNFLEETIDRMRNWHQQQRR